MMSAAVMPTVDPVEPFPDRLALRDRYYHQLMVAACGGRNSHFLATILSSWRVGDSALPACIGLTPEKYRQLFADHFPGVEWPEDELGRGALDVERMPERDDLIQLMVDSRTGLDESELLIAEVVAAACLGLDHLWQDMGLWSRSELSDLLLHNFPALAQRNDRDMKWKKFLYKQLCDQQGIYVCRAPSCDVCSEYHVCFGPEE